MKKIMIDMDDVICEGGFLRVLYTRFNSKRKKRRMV